MRAPRSIPRYQADSEVWEAAPSSSRLIFNPDRDVKTNSAVGPMYTCKACGPVEKCKPTRCLHETSVMTTSNPNAFIKYPYRPSMMTLLRSVHLTMNDPYHYGLIPNMCAAYASLQNHWSPECNIPVLTVVTPCNTTISSPFFRRTAFDFGKLDFSFSTDEDQRHVSFDIPLIINAEHARNNCVIECKYSLDSLDVMNIYEIQQQQSEEVMFRIVTIQLSSNSCNHLHKTSLLIPFQHTICPERIILGLSGLRETVFNIQFPPKADAIIDLLDDNDLMAIGYIHHRKFKKPIYVQKRLVKDYDNLFPRTKHMDTSTICLSDVEDTVDIEVPVAKTRSHGNLKTPKLFPPIKSKCGKDLSNLDKKPLRFPPGYMINRLVPIPDNYTVFDVLMDMKDTSRIDSMDEAYSIFQVYYQVAYHQVEENLKMQMNSFIESIGHQQNMDQIPIWFIPPKQADRITELWKKVAPHNSVMNEVVHNFLEIARQNRVISHTSRPISNKRKIVDLDNTSVELDADDEAPEEQPADKQSMSDKHPQQKLAEINLDILLHCGIYTKEQIALVKKVLKHSSPPKGRATSTDLVNILYNTPKIPDELNVLNRPETPGTPPLTNADHTLESEDTE